MNSHKLVTRSGRILDLDDPREDQICIYDIAWALAHEIRWNGCLGWLTVLHHSMIVEKALPDGSHPRLRLYALLHDAAEAYTGDIVSPVKRMLGATFATLEERLLSVIQCALTGSESSEEDDMLIAAADDLTARWEAAELGTANWRDGIERVASGFIYDRSPLIVSFSCRRDAPTAVDEFINRYDELKSEMRSSR